MDGEGDAFLQTKITFLQVITELPLSFGYAKPPHWQGFRNPQLFLYGKLKTLEDPHHKYALPTLNRRLCYAAEPRQPRITPSHINKKSNTTKEITTIKKPSVKRKSQKPELLSRTPTRPMLDMRTLYITAINRFLQATQNPNHLYFDLQNQEPYSLSMLFKTHSKSHFWWQFLESKKETPEVKSERQNLYDDTSS